MTICSFEYGRSLAIAEYGGIPAALFDILLVALVLYGSIVHALETRRTIGGGQMINKYMILLVQHNALYFFLYGRFRITAPNAHACPRNLLYKALGMGVMLSSSVSNSRLPGKTLTPVQTPFGIVGSLYAKTVPFVIYSRLVLAFRGYRLSKGGLHIDSGGIAH